MRHISVGTAPTDDGTGLVISVQIKQGDVVTVLYSSTHPIDTAALGAKCLTGFELVEVEEPTYTITRFFRDPRNPSQVLHRGLSLEEVQEHCSDPESSSSTATSPEAQARTTQFGDWFDGFCQED